MIKSSIKLFYVSIIMFLEKWGDVNKKKGYFASSTPPLSIWRFYYIYLDNNDLS